MLHRRRFLKNTGIVFTGLALAPAASLSKNFSPEDSFVSQNADITTSLKVLKATHAGAGFTHESFYKDDASKFTREWLAWANTLFGEFIIKVADEKPHLLNS